MGLGKKSFIALGGVIVLVSGFVAPPASTSAAAADSASNPVESSLVGRSAIGANRAGPGYANIMFENTTGVPKTQQSVLLWQGKRRVIVRKPGVVRLPNRSAWNVVPLLANAEGGTVVDPVTHRGNVFPIKRKKKARKLKKGAATLRVDFSNRTSTPARIATSSVIDGPVSVEPGEGDSDAIPGWSLLRVPVGNPPDFPVGEPILIGRDVPGFPNGFVGKVIRSESGAVIVEAINPLSVWTNIDFSQEVEGEIVLPQLTDPRSTELPRAGWEAKCEHPTLRSLISNIEPNLVVTFKNDNLAVKQFGYSLTIGMRSTDRSSVSISATSECLAGMEFPGIKLPLGIQANIGLYGFMQVTGSGEVTFKQLDASVNQGFMFTDGQGESIGTGASVSPVEFEGAELEWTVLGAKGRFGLQWPADIEIAKVKAEVSVEAWVEPSADLVELVAPSTMQDCLVSRRTQVNAKAGVTQNSEISIGIFGVGKSWEIFSYDWSSDPFWRACVQSKGVSETCQERGDLVAKALIGREWSQDIGAEAFKELGKACLKMVQVTTEDGLPNRAAPTGENGLPLYDNGRIDLELMTVSGVDAWGNPKKVIVNATYVP